jgi:phosphoserine phosphatase RsbU/P
MQILVAEDDAPSLKLIETILGLEGHEAISAQAGDAAWEVLQRDDPPVMAILDWGLPGVSGVEVLRRLRESSRLRTTYVILLTARADREDVLAGFAAGADDYITKPFDRAELEARVRAGVRVVELQEALAGRVRELEAALGRVRQLEGLMPICAWCRRVRQEQSVWKGIEAYVEAHTDMLFTHSICPDCRERFAQPAIEEARRRRTEQEPR